jgi:hypothetical protein
MERGMEWRPLWPYSGRLVLLFLKHAGLGQAVLILQPEKVKT